MMGSITFSLFVIMLLRNDLIAEKRQLYIAALIPYLKSDSHCFESAMKAAIRHINNDSAVLSGYELQLHSYETHVSFLLEIILYLLYPLFTTLLLVFKKFSSNIYTLNCKNSSIFF